MITTMPTTAEGEGYKVVLVDAMQCRYEESRRRRRIRVCCARGCRQAAACTIRGDPENVGVMVVVVSGRFQVVKVGAGMKTVNRMELVLVVAVVASSDHAHDTDGRGEKAGHDAVVVVVVVVVVAVALVLGLAAAHDGEVLALDWKPT